METFVNGQKIILSQKNYVTKGEWGSIYKIGKVAYKVYENLQKMIPLGKIDELKTITDPAILSPKEPIYNIHKYLIGFTMNWLDRDIITLCKLFTNEFRDANGITPDMTTELVENIKLKIHHIHQNKYLLVNGNELNYMVADDFVTPYFIDVNTWNTPSFEVTTIMPSIHDWSIETFDENTDWFSFAIVAFQLFVGVHPFKGQHSAYQKNDFVGRIKDGISVFHSNVLVPSTARDFSLIPTSYKEWFFKIFEHGNRIPPPDLPGQLGCISVQKQLIQSTDNFEITELKEFEDQVLFHNAQFNVTKTQSKLYIGKTDYDVGDVEVLFTPSKQIPILVDLDDGNVRLKAIGYNNPIIDLIATDKMIIDNVLYLRNREKLMEMSFEVIGEKVQATIKRTWNIEVHASDIFSNIIYQSELGSAILSIPLPRYTRSGFIKKRLPELDKYKIIDAKYENHVCVLTGHKSNQYDRIIIIFDEHYHQYKVRVIRDIDYNAINFTTLDNGICIMITDDVIETFMNRIDKPNIKRIDDPVINSTMRLCKGKDGTSFRFFRDNKLYQIKIK